MQTRGLVAIVGYIAIQCGCSEPERMGPRLVAPGVVDVGTVEVSDQPLTATLSLVNVGDADLHITSVATSCQCTVAEQVPGVLAPGAGAEVVIRIDPSQGRGTSVVRVESNDPYQGLTEVMLRWTATSHLYAEPARVDFGALRPGETVEQVVALRGALEKCQPGTPFHSPAELEVVSFSATQITIRVTAGEKSGSRSGSVRIPFEECSRFPVRIPVDWSVHELVEASPSRLFLGSAAPGQRLRKPLIIRTMGDVLAIESVRVVELEGASATLTNDGELSRVVTVEWTAPQSPGAFTGAVVVECEQPAGVRIEVPVSAIVLDAA